MICRSRLNHMCLFLVNRTSMLHCDCNREVNESFILSSSSFLCHDWVMRDLAVTRRATKCATRIRRRNSEKETSTFDFVLLSRRNHYFCCCWCVRIINKRTFSRNIASSLFSTYPVPNEWLLLLLSLLWLKKNKTMQPPKLRSYRWTGLWYPRPFKRKELIILFEPLSILSLLLYRNMTNHTFHSL